MKQTAVEWLLENLITEPFLEEHFEYNYNCWDKAKEMEKDQIMNAWYDGWIEVGDNSEHYYNETYKK